MWFKKKQKNYLEGREAIIFGYTIAWMLMFLESKGIVRSDDWNKFIAGYMKKKRDDEWVERALRELENP